MEVADARAAFWRVEFGFDLESEFLVWHFPAWLVPALVFSALIFFALDFSALFFSARLPDLFVLGPINTKGAAVGCARLLLFEFVEAGRCFALKSWEINSRDPHQDPGRQTTRVLPHWPETQKARPGGCAFLVFVFYIYYIKLGRVKWYEYWIYFCLRMNGLGEKEGDGGLDKVLHREREKGVVGDTH